MDVVEAHAEYQLNFKYEIWFIWLYRFVGIVVFYLNSIFNFKTGFYSKRWFWLWYDIIVDM